MKGEGKARQGGKDGKGKREGKGKWKRREKEVKGKGKGSEGGGKREKLTQVEKCEGGEGNFIWIAREKSPPL